MRSELDATDNSILALLMDNARLPVSTIAKQVGIARTTVIARIAALEKRGVIVGYGVRLNAGLSSAVRAYVGISVEAKSSTQLIAFLRRQPEVESLSAVSGMIDYMLILRCATTASLDALLDLIGAQPGVRQTSSSIILSNRIDRAPLT